MSNINYTPLVSIKSHSKHFSSAYLWKCMLLLIIVVVVFYLLISTIFFTNQQKHTRRKSISVHVIHESEKQRLKELMERDYRYNYYTRSCKYINLVIATHTMQYISIIVR